MAKKTNETMQVVTQAEEENNRGARGFGEGVELITRTLDVQKLKEEFQTFVGTLQSIVDTHKPDTGVFKLKEIQFSAEITAKGEFKLLGTGIGVEGSSTITFVLEHNEDKLKTV